MTDQTTETPEVADEEVVPATEAADELVEEVLEDQDQPESEPEPEEEVRIGERTYKVKKGTLPEELAAELRSLPEEQERRQREAQERLESLNAREQTLDQLGHLNEDILNSYAEGRALMQRLEKFDQIDMNRLWQEDATKAGRIAYQRQVTKDQLDRVRDQVAAKEAELHRTRDGEMARRLEEGRREVKRSIPEWNADTEKQIVEYVTSQHGIPETQAKNWALNPSVTRLAYKAMLWDRAQSQAKAKSAPQAAKPAQQQRPVKPVAKSGGRTEATPNRPDGDRLSINEWMKRRQAR